MREEDGVWFAKWEEELPSPDELMPLSQTLITPDLAVAFDIRDQKTPVPAPVAGGKNSSPEFGADSSELGGSGAAGGDEPARMLKRPRLVWTSQLHKRFVDAVAHLGIKNAVPKTIMQLMSFDGLTRENVASHLQKYRLYLKRMQGLSSGGGGVADAATEHLFASSPVPAHFLHPGRASSEHFVPFLPQQMAVVGAHPHLQSHYHRQLAHLPNGQFDYPFLSRQTQQQQQQQGSVHRVGGANVHGSVPGYVLDSANGNGGRKVLTLFPTGED